MNSMKKITIALAAITAAFSFVSCNKEAATAVAEKQKIHFDITVGNLSPDTKAAKTGWDEGDKINIWFDENFETTPDLVITYNGSSWDGGELREGVSLKESGGTLVALYESQNDLTKYSLEKIPDQYLSISYGTVSSFNGKDIVSPSSMVAFSSQQLYYSYSEEMNTLTAELDSWKFLNGIQVTVTDIPEGVYALQADAGDALMLTRSFLLLRNGVDNSGLDYGFAESECKDGQAVFYFYATRWDIDQTNQSVTFTLVPKVDGSYPVSGEFIYRTTIPVIKKGHPYQAFKISFDKFKTGLNGHEYVDMGNGLKWATMNVGALKDTEAGDLFAWAETEAKDTYNWATYKHMESGKASVTYINKYSFDTWEYNPGILDDIPRADKVSDLAGYDYEDDAARKQWGSTWRIPKKSEWDFLLENCTWEWTSEDGVDGFKLTSKINGNSIFLPSAEIKDDEYDESDASEDELIPSAGYWASSILEQAYEFANGLFFLTATPGEEEAIMAYFLRNAGLLVRPVSE